MVHPRYPKASFSQGVNRTDVLTRVASTLGGKRELFIRRKVFSTIVTMGGLVAEDCAVACSVFCVILANTIVRALHKRQEKRRRQRWWVREWITRRPVLGASRFIDTELKHRYPYDLKNLLRMTEMQFEYLLSRPKYLMSLLSLSTRWNDMHATTTTENQTLFDPAARESWTDDVTRKVHTS